MKADVEGHKMAKAKSYMRLYRTSGDAEYHFRNLSESIHAFPDDYGYD